MSFGTCLLHHPESSLFCFADHVFVEVHAAAQTVIFDILVEAMHSGHLFRTVDHRREADDVIADLLVEAGVGGAGHDIWRNRQAREGFFDSIRHPLKDFAMDVCGF